MKIAIIVPLHDPTWLSNVRSNIARQRGFFSDVIVAVNGSAKDFQSEDWSVTHSDPSHASAVNAGVSRCRELGITHAVCMDSDDFYGEGYAAQAIEAFQHGADFTGKTSVYCWMSDGLRLFERPGKRFMGGTLGFAIDRYVPMRSIHQDDSDWHDRMTAAGHQGVDTGPQHYAYVRCGQNSHWVANDVIARKALGPSKFYSAASITDVSGDPGSFTFQPSPTDEEIFAAL